MQRDEKILLGAVALLAFAWALPKLRRGELGVFRPVPPLPITTEV